MKVIWLFSDPNLHNDNTLKKLEKDLKTVYPKLTINCQSISTVGNLPPCDKVVLFFFISGGKEYNDPIKNTIEQIKQGLPNTPVELIVLRDCRMDKVELSIGNVDVTSKEIFTIYTAVSGMPMALVFQKPKNYSEETFEKAVDNFREVKAHLKKVHHNQVGTLTLLLQNSQIQLLTEKYSKLKTKFNTLKERTLMIKENLISQLKSQLKEDLAKAFSF